MIPALLIRRCRVCADVFTPRRVMHRLCRRCFAWHTFGVAVAKFAQRSHKGAP